jgi:hypothetical protein
MLDLNASVRVDVTVYDFADVLVRITSTRQKVLRIDPVSSPKRPVDEETSDELLSANRNLSTYNHKRRHGNCADHPKQNRLAWLARPKATTASMLAKVAMFSRNLTPDEDVPSAPCRIDAVSGDLKVTFTFCSITDTGSAAAEL